MELRVGNDSVRQMVTVKTFSMTDSLDKNRNHTFMMYVLYLHSPMNTNSCLRNKRHILFSTHAQ